MLAWTESLCAIFKTYYTSITAMELTRDMPPEHQCKIVLQFLSGTDHCRYNLLTISEEIAAVVPGIEEQFSNSWDIILHRKAREPLQQISEIHPFYPALHYILLFPTGQMGWNHQIPSKTLCFQDRSQRTVQISSTVSSMTSERNS